MNISCKYMFSFLLLVLGILTPLAALPSTNSTERNRMRAPQEDIQIYNENYSPPNYGYNGYQQIQTPAEAFPDDAEANYLFQKMHE